MDTTSRTIKTLDLSGGTLSLSTTEQYDYTEDGSGLNVTTVTRTIHTGTNLDALLGTASPDSVRTEVVTQTADAGRPTAEDRALGRRRRVQEEHDHLHVRHAGRVHVVTYADTATTSTTETTEYDPVGHVVSKAVVDSAPNSENPSFTYTLNLDGQPSAVIGPRANEFTVFAYNDPIHRLTKKTVMSFVSPQLDPMPSGPTPTRWVGRAAMACR